MRPIKEWRDRYVQKMSWEYPVEEQLLAYVRHMAQQMEAVAENNRNPYRKPKGFLQRILGGGSLSEGAANYADAYRTVEREILRIMEFKK